MRARNIKPGLFANELLAECDPLARLLFTGLWCLADKEGKLEDRPKRIKHDVLGYDDCDVEMLLEQLASRGFIERYTAAGVAVIRVVNFDKHQRPHSNEQPSVLPNPEDVVHDSPIDGTTVHQGEQDFAPREEALRPDPLIPDSLNVDNAAASATAASNGHKPKPTSQSPRPDHAMHDAFKDEYGYEPGNDTERQRWNKANKLCRDAGVMPEDVPVLHATYKRKYPHAADTVMAMAGRAGELLAEARASPREEYRGIDITGISQRRASG